MSRWLLIIFTIVTLYVPSRTGLTAYHTEVYKNVTDVFGGGGIGDSGKITFKTEKGDKISFCGQWKWERTKGD